MILKRADSQAGRPLREEPAHKLGTRAAAKIQIEGGAHRKCRVIHAANFPGRNPGTPAWQPSANILPIEEPGSAEAPTHVAVFAPPREREAVQQARKTGGDNPRISPEEAPPRQH